MKKKGIALRNLIIVIIVAITGMRCSSNGSNPHKNVCNGCADTNFSFVPSYTIPADVDTDASEAQLAAYAWQEFLALNWKSSYSTDSTKGNPDTTWSFADSSKPVPDIVVWETYAHRTELSPYQYPMRNFDSLCNYSYQYPPKRGDSSANFGYLHNLDETSEIGSCTLYAFADVDGHKHLVRYQAKTNRSEYNYIKNNFLNQNALNVAQSNTAKYIRSAYANNGVPDSTKLTNPMIVLPDSSIEVKSAWRELTKYDDSSMFFTRTVITYYNNPGDTNFYYTNKKYALIGLHIIHKSKKHPSFVFATWQHVDVYKDSMKYNLLSQAGSPSVDSGGLRQPVRNKISPVTSASTRYVHKILPHNSIWKNYMLVGVQGKPTNNDTTQPNFFLANYVIESDSLLARFHGSGFANPFNAQPNVVYNKALYSVGGCQGCHGGGAQHSGTDFSFIVNSPNTNPDAVPDSGTNQMSSLRGINDRIETKLNRLKRTYK